MSTIQVCFSSPSFKYIFWSHVGKYKILQNYQYQNNCHMTSIGILPAYMTLISYKLWSHQNDDKSHLMILDSLVLGDNQLQELSPRVITFWEYNCTRTANRVGIFLVAWGIIVNNYFWKFQIGCEKNISPN